MCRKFVEECENMSDEEIVLSLSSDNYAEIQVLINRYMPLIIKTVSRYSSCVSDAEDLIQEGVIAIFSAVKSYDPSKARFSTFVSHCITRAILAQLKSSGASKRIPDALITPLDDADVGVADISDPESIYISKESYEHFKANICASLSELEYKVLYAFVSGDSYSKISADLGISVKSVDNSLRRIRTKLKK